MKFLIVSLFFWFRIPIKPESVLESEVNIMFYIGLLTGAILGMIIGAGMERRTNKTLKMVRRIQQHEPYALLHLSMKYFWPEEQKGNQTNDPTTGE